MSKSKALPTRDSDAGIFPHAPMTWADYARYLIALVAVAAVLYLVVSGGEFGSLKAEATGWGRVILGFALASALGHAAPSLLRGRISLTLSSALTWLMIVSFVAYLEDVRSVSAVVESIVFSSFLVSPLIVLAHVMRIVVPALRPHIDGKPVRYAMSGSSPITSS